MKKFIILILTLVSVWVSDTTLAARNRWNVSAGGSISHLCESTPTLSNKSYGWGGGAFIGGGYEINFNNRWNLMPSVEISYVNNGATINDTNTSFGFNHYNWLETWSIDVPILAGFRFPVSDFTRLKIGIGPYLRESFAGRRYDLTNESKTSMEGSFADKFNIGVQGEVAVETGDHLSYMFRVQYPFLKEGWIRKTLTLSVGVRYTF